MHFTDAHVDGEPALRPGDVVLCDACGYRFVFRRRTGALGGCQRCASPRVARWKP